MQTLSEKWISIGLVFTEESVFFNPAVQRICNHKFGMKEERSQKTQPFCARSISKLLGSVTPFSKENKLKHFLCH